MDLRTYVTIVDSQGRISMVPADSEIPPGSGKVDWMGNRAELSPLTPSPLVFRGPQQPSNNRDPFAVAEKKEEKPEDEQLRILAALARLHGRQSDE